MKIETSDEREFADKTVIALIQGVANNGKAFYLKKEDVEYFYKLADKALRVRRAFINEREKSM